MDQNFLRALLYRAESVDLDFKREQYKVSGSDAEKSELVKDVLAMANAWRESTSYIILGVAENKSDLPTVVGITDLHDDAHFQQIVNSKVHPKIDFAYEVCKLDGLLVGVISVPKQKRPFYLPKRFGDVNADTVYLRRGSSTAIAKPDEIAAMGQGDAQRREPPKVSMTLTDADGENISSSVQKLVLVSFGDIKQLPDYKEPDVDAMYSMLNIHHSTNSDYWREGARHVVDKFGWVRTTICIKNESRYSLTHCKLEFTATDASGNSLAIRYADDLARAPKQGLKIPKSLYDVGASTLNCSNRQSVRRRSVFIALRKF
jgi:Putative DNA-binding domain